MINVKYMGLCPVCGEELSNKEIESLICSRRGRSLELNKSSKQLEEFEEFFYKLTGSKLRNIQKIWAKRILQGRSESLLAPTGIGKTLFGVVMAIYLSIRGKSCYLLFPTTTLIKNVEEKMQMFIKTLEGNSENSGNVNKNINIIFYYGNLKKKDKEERKKAIEEGNYNILITTYSFLSKNFELIKKRFDFVFIDDVDSLLKNSRNLNKIISILKENSILLFSSATGKPGKGAKILREKLGLEVGALRETLRNIEDLYYENKDIKKVIELIKKIGKGGLIFTNSEEDAKHIVKVLKDGGISCELVLGGEKDNTKHIERFKEGELQVLVGVARPYGLMVRGIDLPEIIRYAIFFGAPSFSFNLKKEENTQLSEAFLIGLGKRIYALTKNKKILWLIKNKNLNELKNIVMEFIENNEESLLEKVGIFKKENIIWVPDIKTYIQASGRTSRLFSGGIAKGLSIVLEEKKYLDIFRERAAIWDIELKELEKANLEKIVEEIDRDREEMKHPSSEFDPVKVALLIVESPNKARQIAKFFGRPIPKRIGNTTAYEIFTGEYLLLIVASIGHVVDLTTENIAFHGIDKEEKNFTLFYAPIKRCRDCTYQYASTEKVCPKCGSNNIYDAKERIDALREFVDIIEFVMIGTDPDVEGEKIAWDLYNLLRPYAREIKRIEFHEVTKPAILKAIKEMRDIKQSLVNAQLVRRVDDRLIGFELSHIVQKKFRNNTLSAGRAQTPVLGWVVEKEKGIKKKVPIFINEDLFIRWVLEGKFKRGRTKINVHIKKIKEEERDKVIVPFTTDTLLKEGQRILKMDVNEIMRRAQKLFEMGLITYHRTDSTRISNKGLMVAKYILKEDFVPRTFSHIGAHEAIRPTKPISPEELRVMSSEFVEAIDEKDIALYRLIYNRFLASQTQAIKEKIIKYVIRYRNKLIEEERVVESYGKAKEFYPYASLALPELPEGNISIEGHIYYYPKEFPYTQADLVSLMKERGIGRPSTYAKLIEVLFQRKYVKEVKRFIRATPLGEAVFLFLKKYYESFISESRTRQLENIMKDVEENKTSPEEAMISIWEEVRDIENIRIKNYE